MGTLGLSAYVLGLAFGPVSISLFLLYSPIWYYLEIPFQNALLELQKQVTNI
jgi:hypothetical protein